MKKLTYLPIILSLAINFSSCNRGYIKPERKDVIDAVFASGNVFYFDEYNVVSNTDGYIKKILKRQGDSVEAGEKVFVVANIITASQVDIAELNYQDAITKYTPNSPTLMQKQEQVILAQKQLKKDSIDYARNKRLFKVNAISTLDLENSEIQYQTSLSNYIVQKNSLAETLEDLNLTRRSTQKQLDIQKQSDAYNDLVSGIKGVLAVLNLNEGDLVTTGTVIATITGGKVKTRLYIDETDINRVKLGQKVLVSLNTQADTSIEARVTRIYPSFDITDQAFVAEADFVNPPPNLYLFTQTQLQANIIAGTHKHALVIPTSCIVKNSVQVKGEKEPRQVKTGIVSGTWTEILSGINDNDELILPKKK